MSINAIMLTFQWLTLGYMIWLFEKSKRQHEKHMKELDEQFDNMDKLCKIIEKASDG